MIMNTIKYAIFDIELNHPVEVYTKQVQFDLTDTAAVKQFCLEQLRTANYADYMTIDDVHLTTENAHFITLGLVSSVVFPPIRRETQVVNTMLDAFNTLSDGRIIYLAQDSEGGEDFAMIAIYNS